MTKEVVLTTRGMQFAMNEQTGEGENIEIVTSALYYDKGDYSYLVYEEILEGVDEPVSNLVKFNSDCIEVTKKGLINVHMIFETGKQNMTNYHTPFGDLMIGINTHKVQVTKSEDQIHLEASYGMDINYEFLSDCQISMDIAPKET